MDWESAVAKQGPTMVRSARWAVNIPNPMKRATRAFFRYAEANGAGDKDIYFFRRFGRYRKDLKPLLRVRDGRLRSRWGGYS